MFKLKVCFILFMLLILITSCSRPTELEFSTDPSILRGAWTAAYKENDDPNWTPDPIAIDIPIPADLALTATYVDKDSYKVLGTWTNEDEVLELRGDVYGVLVEYIAPQTTLVPTRQNLIADLSRNGEVIASLCASGYDEFYLQVGEPGTYVYSSSDMFATCPQASSAPIVLSR